MTAAPVSSMIEGLPIVPRPRRNRNPVRNVANERRARDVVVTAFPTPDVPWDEDRVHSRMPGAREVAGPARASAAFADLGHGLTVIE